MAPERELMVKWSGQELKFTMGSGATVGELKRKIAEQTSVQPKRQKLLGLKAKGAKLASDEVLIEDLVLKPGAKIMMMGTPEAVTAALDVQAEVAPHVQDDFNTAEGVLEDVAFVDREENQEKLRRRIASVDVKVLNPPRPGKKCLVLDIDYTLFDLGSAAERPEELARPHLHEFLAACYEHYDIVIWSATSMKWIEVKMRELGCATHPAYRLVCYLDHKAMVTCRTDKYGVFDCKPLPLLWAKFSEHYGEHNTVMLDDLARNYVYNKQNGLVIRPYRHAHRTRSTDRELLKLCMYLCKIAHLPSLHKLKHRRWESYIADELDDLLQAHGGS
ncbi:hypothetical protein WJX81_000663 [Elliptochloris bilobata]|uniref:protein-serine/threonine phosphatase n=1 Tax=Elliptochloris bilobata TaxID=381761 RepID=A0AAW1RIY4_9CHLO